MRTPQFWTSTLQNCKQKKKPPFLSAQFVVLRYGDSRKLTWFPKAGSWKGLLSDHEWKKSKKENRNHPSMQPSIRPLAYSFNRHGDFTLPGGMLGIPYVPGRHCALCNGVIESKAQPLPSRSTPSNAERVQWAQFTLTRARAKCACIYGT